MKAIIFIPTKNGGAVWRESISSIRSQVEKLTDVIVVDSLSSDDTALIAKENNCHLVSISPAEFGHGKTRNLAMGYIDDVDIIVFLTQDAILQNTCSLKYILDFFKKDESIAAVCGRQIPHDDASPLAIHARCFNYPNKSSVKSQKDIKYFGIKTVFMSNSFAAYRAKIFKELGGFPESVILAEDMYLSAKLILAGYKIGYCAEAIVKHSHNYTPLQEFQRYFDIGVFHACEPWIRDKFGGAGGEGMRFIRSELTFLWKTAPLWIPRSLITSACKLFGYKLGQRYRKLPWSWCRSFSMYKSYWLQNKI